MALCFWDQFENCQKQVINKKGNSIVEISTIKDSIHFLYLYCAFRLNQVTDFLVPLLLAYFPSSLNSSLWSLVNCNVQDYNMENVFEKIKLDPKRKKSILHVPIFMQMVKQVLVAAKIVIAKSKYHWLHYSI